MHLTRRFGKLFCIVSGLPTRETCVAALIVFPDRISHNVLDLVVGLVGILLPGWFELKLRLLPGTSLLNWLSILLGLELVFMIIINWLIFVNQFVFPFCYKGLVYQSLKVGKSNMPSVHRRCWLSPPRNRSIFLSSVVTS